jgi:transcription elongation factor GreA
MSAIPMTVRGKSKLDEELKHLKSVERPKVIQEIATARAHGDLSENAEYDAAKEKQAFIEGRIKEIEDKLARAQVVDPREIRTDKIVF